MQAVTPHVHDLRRVFELHFDDVWRFLVRLGAPSADAEDLAQNVFVVAHRRLASFEPSRAMRPWLFGIARNVLRDHRRLAVHRHELPSADVDELRSDPHLRAFEASQILYAALAELPEPLRAIVVAHDLEDLEMREAAEALDVPIDTAYARLRRGRALLKATVERLAGGAR
jgi:RNA polymerase sigma-70 factor (ECF subfamily)